MVPRARVEKLAAGLGFPRVGVLRAGVIPEAREAALRALEAGYLADMRWMTEGWVRRSADPREFLAGCRSVVVVGLEAPSTPPPGLRGGENGRRGRIARYAWGRDYHRVFERRLRGLATSLRREFGGTTRITVDYGPLLERSLAARAGLGWIGRSTMLLVPGLGPWLLLGVVATTVEIEAGSPLKKSCGSCRRCVAACPTGALGADGGRLDSRLCLSYLTIENRGPIPRPLRRALGDRVFGCDDCLEACPVGRQGRRPGCEEFSATVVDDARPLLVELVSLGEEEFRQRFAGRAVRRARRDGIARNACVALGNCGQAADLAPLVAALADPSPLVRGHAAWGVGRLARRLSLPRETVRLPLETALYRERDPFVREELNAALLELTDEDRGRRW